MNLNFFLYAEGRVAAVITEIVEYLGVRQIKKFELSNGILPI